jgi:hypothetical protein
LSDVHPAESNVTQLATRRHTFMRPAVSHLLDRACRARSRPRFSENWAASTPLVTLGRMDRRTKRSKDRDEALQYLVEALADRSETDAVVLVNDQGRIVAGTGMHKELRGLAKIALPVMRGEGCEDFESETRGTDFFGREIRLPSGPLYLAALGTRVRKMHEAVYAVTRILEPAHTTS